jgi:hypothetical protein
MSAQKEEQGNARRRAPRIRTQPNPYMAARVRHKRAKNQNKEQKKRAEPPVSFTH